MIIPGNIEFSTDMLLFTVQPNDDRRSWHFITPSLRNSGRKLLVQRDRTPSDYFTPRNLEELRGLLQEYREVRHKAW
jgi:hypothetical protein